jgi:integrase
MLNIDEPQRIVYFIGNERYEEVYPKYELLTSHCGRRTFIVSALYLGIPAEVIMKWTGHSDYDSMKPYVKIIDDLKRDSMKKFDKK